MEMTAFREKVFPLARLCQIQQFKDNQIILRFYDYLYDYYDNVLFFFVVEIVLFWLVAQKR